MDTQIGIEISIRKPIKGHTEKYKARSHAHRKVLLKLQVISKCIKAMGMIQKQRNWAPYELKPRDVEWRFFDCKQLLQRQNQKGFSHRIMTGDGQTEYLRCQGYALHLVGPAQCGVLSAVETE